MNLYVYGMVVEHLEKLKYMILVSPHFLQLQFELLMLLQSELK